MRCLKYFTYVWTVLILIISTAQSQYCSIETELSGTISQTITEPPPHPGSGRGSATCWTIPVPKGNFIRLQLNHIRSELECRWDNMKHYVEISVLESQENYVYCKSDNFRNAITALTNVTVTHYCDTNSYYYGYNMPNFALEYKIKNFECVNKDSIKCNDNFCVKQSQACDGTKDCENGEDEVGCEIGVLSIKGVVEARENAVSWLRSKINAISGWQDDTPRAIVALYLASDVNFNDSILENQLMANLAELKTAVALLRSSLTDSELSVLINALLVTCHNPRKFYGHDLVERLKELVQGSQTFTHPLAYLSLCNADEPWPSKAISDLSDILNSNSEYPVLKDLQAVAVMAVSCITDDKKSFSYLIRATNLTSYHDTIERFKKLQLRDGSFGNVYTTALITQALISSGQQSGGGWNLNKAINYLMKETNSSSVDFLSVYLTLPIFNGKSLTDISNINCSSSSRKYENDPVLEIRDYLESKIRVQYSLYIGDEKDVIHTISLRVPRYYTAAEVMELAVVEDPKYQFKYKKMSEKMYVYEIANVTNDPDMRKFWLLYVGASNETESLTNFTTSPDELVMADGEHLVLWYKTTSI